MSSIKLATTTGIPIGADLLQDVISSNILHFLDQEFGKFEEQAKNCDRYTILDLRLPVRIIELFLKLFQLCVDNPVLRQNIDSVELFAKIFLLMRSHFKAQCPCGLDVDWEAEKECEDDDGDDDDVDEDDDWGDCGESDPLKRFLHFIKQQEAKASIGLKDASNKKLVKNLKHVSDWFLELDGTLICEICNFKCKKYNDVVAHSKQPSHDRNLDIFKENESFAAFPDAKIESYGCKACKSEYSTFNSLVKHFDKSQHRDVVKKLPVGVTVSKDDNGRTKNDAKPTITVTKVDKNDANSKPTSTKTNDSTEGKKAVVKINYKAKVTNATASTVQSTDNVKSQTNNVAKVETKPGSQTKPTNTKAETKPVKVSNATTTVESKPLADTSKSKVKPSKPDEPKTASNTSTSKTKTVAAAKKKPEYSLKFIVSNGSSGKYCQICDWDLPDEEAIVSHAKGTDGSDHAKLMSVFESNQEYVKTSINCDNFVCMLCCEHAEDIYELTCHFKSKDHKATVKSKTASPEAPTTPKADQKPAAGAAAKAGQKPAAKVTTQPASKSDQKSAAKVTPQPASKPDQKPAPKTTPQPAPKPAPKLTLNSLKLKDSDSKFLRQKSNKIQCIVCDVTLNVLGDVTEHFNDQLHSQNVSEFTKHEEYVELPNAKASSFNCLKCNSVFNTFVDILTHCKEHIEPPKPTNPLDSIKLKKSDEKFISKGKTEKSLKCNLCDKELPTESAVISHTGSSNHVKNYNMFIKNEPYCVANKTSCSLCEHNCHDLAALVKHFKTDTHQKTAVKGKKTQTQAPIHIPSYAKPKLDQIVDIPEVIDSPKSLAPKKSKKIEEGSVRKSRLQLLSMGDLNLEELMSYEQFPMKRPDNSYVIAKNDLFYCRICDVDLPAAEVAAHMNGASHRINVEVFESLQCYVLSTPESEYVQCTMCKVTFDHVHQLVKHFRETLHGKPVNLEKPKPSVPVPPTEDQVDTSEQQQNTPTEAEIPPACDSDPAPATDVVENKVEEEKSSPPPPKPVRIPKSDRKHIFRLGGTLVQCNLCNTKLADNEALEAHVNNLNHIKNSTVYLENEQLIKQLDSVGSLFECTSCAFNGDLSKVIKHCKKKQHLAAKGCNVEDISDDEMLEDDEDDVDPTINEFDFKCITMKNGIVRCKLCHNKLTGVKNLLEHMNSENHKMSSDIYKQNEPFIEQFDELEFSYKCIICEVIFTRLDTMIRHFTEEGHVPINDTNESPPTASNNDIGDRFDVTSSDFECYLCSVTFNGFAALSKHCYSPQHEVLKNLIQSDQNEIPYNITIVDYQYHCNACNIRLLNKALMEKHQSKRIHKDSVTFYNREVNSSNVIEIVGYEYLCNLCWFPMYSAAELANHERSNTHKSGKNFDDVWRFNERHLIMCQSMYKVRCKLCEKTIGIEKLIKHCTSRDHRLKFIANYSEESSQDRFIVWKNASQYCTLCDCKLINEHNLVNHVNSAKHKLKLLQN
ncbi:uncharacterized protein LOC135838421 isoform X2 [Planococcus citri]